MERLRVAIIEDEPEARLRFERILGAEPWLMLCGSAADAAGGRALIERDAADLYLVDLGLPDGDGRDLIRLATRCRPDIDMLVVTVFGDDAHVITAIEAGATGYLLKDSEPQQVLDWIRTLRSGGSPLNPVIARRLLQRFRQMADGPAPPPGSEVGGDPGGHGGQGGAARRDGHNGHEGARWPDDRVPGRAAATGDGRAADRAIWTGPLGGTGHGDSRPGPLADDRGGGPVGTARFPGRLAYRDGRREAFEPSGEPNPLSGRETEILRLLAKGLSYAEIGELLGISAHTVTQHIKKIYRKLSVHSRGEAVFEATQMGILKVPMGR
jgi:DNA-binding NarL/FixJ family response regulator